MLHRNIAIHIGISDVENRSEMSDMARNYIQIAEILCRVSHIERIVFFSVPWCVKHSRGNALGHVNYRPRAINNFLRTFHADIVAEGATTKIKFFDYSRMFTALDGRQRRAIHSMFTSSLSGQGNVDLIHLSDLANTQLLSQFRQFCRHEYGWS